MHTHNDTDINTKLMHLFWDTAHGLRHTSNGRASQQRILSVLLQNEPISQAKLTEYLGVQAATASEVLAKLESAGLILRTESEEDHRTITLSLTPSGQEQALIAHEEREQRKRDMFSVLSCEEKTELISILQKLTADWRQRYGEPGKRGQKKV